MKTNNIEKFLNSNLGQFLEYSPYILMIIFVTGCSSLPVIPPCPPCVAATRVQQEDLPNPICQEIQEPSYVFCSEPTTLTFSQTGRSDLASASAFQFSNLTVASIGEPECFNAKMEKNPSCVPKVKEFDLYERDGEVCLYNSSAEYDAAMPSSGASTRNRMAIWQNYVAGEACTSNPNCRSNWAWFTGYFSVAGTVPGHDPQILLAPRAVFVKLARPHRYWCEPGPIKANCGSSGTNVDPNPVGVAESSCQPGLAVIAGTMQAAGQGVGGGGAILSALLRGMNLETGAVANAEADRQRTMDHNTASGAATAVKKDGGTLGASGAGSSGSGSGSGGGSGGGGPAGGAAPSVNGLASASSGGSGGGGPSGGENPESAATADRSDLAKQDEVKVVGTGDYDSAASGGGRGGQKGGGFGGLGGGGAPTVGGVSDVAFSKGGSGGPANPLAGLGGGVNDQEFERLLQKNSERSLFEIANRRYFQWGGSVMSGEASDAMKKVSP